MTERELQNNIESLLQDTSLDASQKTLLSRSIAASTKDLISQEGLRNRLQILFEYEKHCLTTIKEYKEEIKFAASLQEDLRRERSQFFTQTLKEVSTTLKQAEVDSETVSEWTKELVKSYTTSLNLSSDLAKTHITDMMGNIREDAKTEVSTVGKGEEE